MRKFLLRYAKKAGLFELSRRLTRRWLLILCYHGVTSGELSDFRPMLFMNVETFRRRMTYLRENGYNILSLNKGLDLLKEGRLSPKSIVLTFDDGFANFYEYAWPELQKFGYPATVYVTSYYAQKQSPVFRLMVQYIIWRCGIKRDQEVPLPPEIAHLQPADYTKGRMWWLIDYAEKNMSEPQRCDLWQWLGSELGVETERLVGARAFHIMRTEEIEELAYKGVDIELHTHRHRFPLERNSAIKEIEDNRKFLEPLVRRKLIHFCYPSGIWSKTHFDLLRSQGIQSAATCLPFLNTKTMNMLRLGRILDSGSYSLLEFEAEVSGFKPLLRSKMDGEMRKSS